MTRTRAVRKKRVVIVGSTSGIARAVAHAYAERGVSLTLIARNAEALEAQAQDLRIRHGAAVGTIVLDLEDAEARAGLVELALQETPAQLAPLMGVLIAAGYMTDNDSARSDADAFASTVHLNHTYLAELAERFADGFEQRLVEERASETEGLGAPVIAGIASVAGDRGRMSNYVYGAAKAAFATHLNGMRHRLAHGAGPIAVVTIKPGMVDTPMTKGLVKAGSPLVASPERVAKDIVRSMEYASRRGRGRVVYTPFFWRLIMLIIRMVPEPVFLKTKL